MRRTTPKSDDWTRDRRTGPRRRGRKGFEGWLEDVVLTGLEVSILGSPALLVIIGGTSAFAIARQYAALIALVVLALTAGTIRGRRERFGAGWWRTSAAAVLPRAIYYNTILLLAAYSGAVVGTYVWSPAGAVLAASVAVVAAVKLPKVQGWIRRSLPYQRRVDDWKS